MLCAQHGFTDSLRAQPVTKLNVMQTMLTIRKEKKSFQASESAFLFSFLFLSLLRHKIEEKKGKVKIEDSGEEGSVFFFFFFLVVLLEVC